MDQGEDAPAIDRDGEAGKTKREGRRRRERGGEAAAQARGTVSVVFRLRHHGSGHERENAEEPRHAAAA